MNFLGIQFAPLNIPLERRLQTLSAFCTFIMLPFLINLGIIITIYVLFYTKYWYFAVLYLIWVWVIDKDTPEQGGRRIEMFCNRKYNYAKNYFPASLKLEEGLALDPLRNYLFCIFPHGVLSVGAHLGITSNSTNFNDIFPHHKVHGLTLNINFKIPIVRDIILFMGICSASAKSICHLLSYPKGGKIAALVVGGAEESIYARPGAYHVVLKNRKGFVKLALKNGCPMVPVFGFGEIELFDQINNPKGSLLRNFQDWFKHKTGIMPIIVYGRGFFQYTFGMVPRRKPLNVVVGKPIEVPKIENPTQEEIDTHHGKFIEELEKLFDTHKHKYIKNIEHAKLIIC